MTKKSLNNIPYRMNRKTFQNKRRMLLKCLFNKVLSYPLYCKDWRNLYIKGVHRVKEESSTK